MEGSRRCFETQIVDGEGNYNDEGVENFMTATNLSDRGRSYAVVAILGPQHGGKSTIMNHLFGTCFRQMDTFGRRSKTTNGIWIAKCAGIDDPFIVAMDVEGTDGKERGEDDTTFEKQSALFALANADLVMINMWCHDLGREHAANKPMLKLVFEVMMRMFSPRKVTLLFVLRDKTQAEQFDNLKADVEQQIQEIWNTATRRHSGAKYEFRKYFRVEVVALSNYHDKKELFKTEVDQMRDRYFGSNLLERDGCTLDRLPASGFACSTKKIWNDIKQNKDLDIPAHRVMVETVRCKEIADDKFGRLSSDKGWLELKRTVMTDPVSRFGRKFRSILDTYLAEFDKEAMYFDEGIRNKQRQELLTRARELANSSFLLLVVNFRCRALEDLKKMFKGNTNERIRFNDEIHARWLELDDACKDAAMELVEWDNSEAREDLVSHINMELGILRDSKLSEFATVAKDKLAKTLSKIIKSIVEDGAEKMWELIRESLVKNTERAVTDFVADIAHLGRGQAKIDVQMKSLRHHAKNVAELKVRKVAEGIQDYMKIRFERVFTRNDDGTAKYWSKVAIIDDLSFEARKESLKLLAAMAALRFEGKADNIQDQLFSALIVGGVMVFDPLASSKWAEVSSSDTLITPEECKVIWAEFISKTEYIVNQAKEKRREYERDILEIEKEYEKNMLEMKKEYERAMAIQATSATAPGGSIASAIGSVAGAIDSLASAADTIGTVIGNFVQS